MHWSLRRSAARAAALCLIGSPLPGCTLLGLGVGGVVDAERAKLKPTQAWRLAALPSGTPIIIDLVDGRRIEGELAGTPLRDFTEYRRDYEAARAEDVRLPELGPCTLREVNGMEHRFELLGLDLQAVVIRAEGGQMRFPFDRLEALRDASGQAVSGPRLKRFAETGGVPLLSMVLLRGVADALPIERIARIEAPSPPKHRAKLMGTIAGLLVDGLLVAMLYPRGRHPLRPAG